MNLDRFQWTALGILLFVLIASTVLFFAYGGNPVDGILPTLIAFGLEGVFFVFILDQREHANEKKKQQQQDRNAKDATKAALRGVIGDIANWMSDWEWDNKDLGEALRHLMEDKAHGKKLDPSEGDKLAAFMNPQLATLRASLPLAAQLDIEQLKRWFSMIANLQAAIDAGTLDQRQTYYQTFLNTAIAFHSNLP